MKLKLLSLIAATALMVSCGTTYTSTTSNAAYGLPENIRSGFTVQYPDATNVTYTAFDAATAPVDWELNGWSALGTDDYVVSFNQGGRQYYAWYDSDGTWVGTSYAVTDHNALPYAVSTMVQSKYKDYTIESVNREMWKDQSAYEIKLKGMNDTKVKLLVDDKGNVLKEKLKD